MGGAYHIRRMAQGDLPLVREWRARPHVRQWWGDPSLEPEQDKLADARLALWIVESAGRPFAFIQDYDVQAWAPHHFDFLPKPSRGLDLFIGEADLLNAGHGSRLLRQHVDQMFREGIQAAGIDPHPDNAAARRAFEKAGFRVVGGPVETRWNRAILMERRPDQGSAAGLDQVEALANSVYLW